MVWRPMRCLLNRSAAAVESCDGASVAVAPENDAIEDVDDDPDDDTFGNSISSLRFP
jgi:hypothetical protein